MQCYERSWGVVCDLYDERIFVAANRKDPVPQIHSLTNALH